MVVLYKWYLMLTVVLLIFIIVSYICLFFFFFPSGERIPDFFLFSGPGELYKGQNLKGNLGALARVKVHYCSLPQLIESLTDIPVYGTFLNGNIIYAESLSAHGLIVMGNEGKGVSPEVERLINKKLYIPNYPQERETSESLNVAIATAVVCSEFRRRLLP